MKGKHVLITGHTGFKGAWLVAMLHIQGAKVSGIALDPKDGGVFELAGIHEFLEHDVRKDIRDGEGLTKAFQDISPDFVIHLAAQPLVLASYANPYETFETNVVGTLNVLKAIEETPCVRGGLIVTTDKVYRHDEKRRTAFKETDALGAADPYSTSKAMADLLTQAWMSTHSNFGLAIARAGNVIGGGDVGENRLLPDLVKAFGNQQKAIIRNPDSVRPWQHVLDCLSGYLLLSEALLSGSTRLGAFNFGPPLENPLPVHEVADIAAAVWGQAATWITEPMEQPHESQFLILDSRKSESLLGWTNKLSSKEAIEWSVQWHQSALSEISPRDLVMEQISSFLER